MPTYRLIEFDRAGARGSEDFTAQNDRRAIKLASEEARGERYELWLGDRLLHEGKPKRR